MRPPQRLEPILVPFSSSLVALRSTRDTSQRLLDFPLFASNGVPAVAWHSLTSALRSTPPAAINGSATPTCSSSPAVAFICKQRIRPKLVCDSSRAVFGRPCSRSLFRCVTGYDLPFYYHYLTPYQRKGNAYGPVRGTGPPPLSRRHQSDLIL